MDRIQSMWAVLIISTALLAAVMVITFKASLPTWCKTPERGGNALVQPLCSKH